VRSRSFIAAAIVALAIALSLPVNAAAQETINATVIRVIDGDTIDVQPASGPSTTVRLLGIDAPESGAPGTPVECGSEDAAAYLTELLLRLPDVVLTTDPSQDRVDRFGRLLTYVDGGTTDVGLAMIRAGHADVFVFEGRPFARLPTYEDVQAEASTAERGVWGTCGGDFHMPGPADETATESRSESAERFVRRYYVLLNERRLSVAWTKLSPALRGRIGPYSRWRSGFRRTLGTA
jgi:micrococcal nuclease